MIKVEIKRATQNDIENAASVHSVSAINSYSKLCDEEFLEAIFGYEKLKKNWEDYLVLASGSKSGMYPILAMNKGKVIGIMRCNVASSEEKQMFKLGGVDISDANVSQIFNVKNIYVDSRFQRCGVGTELMRTAVECAAQEGCKELMTLTLKGYKTSPEFFATVGEAKKWFSIEHDAGSMYKHGSGKKAISVGWKMSLDSVLQYKGRE